MVRRLTVTLDSQEGRRKVLMAESMRIRSLNGLMKPARLAEKVEKAIGHSHRYFRGARSTRTATGGESWNPIPTMEAEYLMLSHFFWTARTRNAGGRLPTTS